MLESLWVRYYRKFRIAMCGTRLKNLKGGQVEIPYYLGRHCREKSDELKETTTDLRNFLVFDEYNLKVALTFTKW